MLKDIVEFYRLVDATAQGVTARDRAKDLPIRILHGGGHAAWLEAQGLQASHPTLPLVAQLEAELRACRREVYAYVQQHDAAWLRGVEDHVCRAETLRPGTRAVARPQAAAEREARGCAGRWKRASLHAGCRTLRMVAWAACGECCRPRAGRRNRGSRTGC